MEKTSPKFFCFVLMPFGKEFDNIYYGIKESCKQTDTYCERVDEQDFEGGIMDRIYNQISKADLIIAEMTGKNPNVFYEVGYAHALNKPTILLTKTSTDIPFDLQGYPHIIHDEKIPNLIEKLSKKIEWFKINSNTHTKDFKTDIDIFVDDKNLLTNNVIHEFSIGEFAGFDFTIHNNSSRSYFPSDLNIGIISKEYSSNNERGVVVTRLPDKLYLHMLQPPFDVLLPEQFTSSRIRFSGRKIPLSDIIIRVYTDTGSRDYPLQIKAKT